MVPTCHKCRQLAVVTGSDGLPYCDYCKQFAPKPVDEETVDDA